MSKRKRTVDSHRTRSTRSVDNGAFHLIPIVIFFLCWAKAHDSFGRSDLFLNSNPRFKKPGTLTVKEYMEMVEREERANEARAKRDL